MSNFANIIIRSAKADDLDFLVSAEKACFTPAEAASREKFAARLKHFSEFIYIAQNNGVRTGFICLLLSQNENLDDEMFENANSHDKNGVWAMILSLGVLPEFRHRQYATKLLNYAICKIKERHLKGVVLTCKEKLLNFYAQFGFINEGISSSEHAGEIWYQMRLKL